MEFSEALKDLKDGKSAYRVAWNNTQVLVEIQFPDEYSANTEPYLYFVESDEMDNVRRIPWLPGNVDLMADDWETF